MSKKKDKVVDREEVDKGFLRGGTTFCSASSPTKKCSSCEKDKVIIYVKHKTGEQYCQECLNIMGGFDGFYD